MGNHKWTKEETRAALDAYLMGLSKAEATKLAESLGINPNAFWMRMANFKYLATDGKEGLSATKKLQQQVWDEYCKYEKK